MVLPKGNQTSKHIGSSKQRTVTRFHRPNRDVIAPTRARVLAINHKLFRA